MDTLVPIAGLTLMAIGGVGFIVGVVMIANWYRRHSGSPGAGTEPSQQS